MYSSRQIIRVTSPLTVFLVDGQLDFYKASDSISDHQTSVQHSSIVVDKGRDQLVGWWWVGLVGHIVVDKGRDQLVGWWVG